MQGRLQREKSARSFIFQRNIYNLTYSIFKKERNLCIDHFQCLVLHSCHHPAVWFLFYIYHKIALLHVITNLS